jgi:hypothetical protein
VPGCQQSAHAGKQEAAGFGRDGVDLQVSHIPAGIRRTIRAEVGIDEPDPQVADHRQGK